MFSGKDDPNHVFQLLQEKKWDEAIQEARRNPRLARELFNVLGFYNGKITSKITALHLAAALEASEEVIQGLVSIHPGATLHQDSYYSRVPLHIAVLSGASFVVSQLLKIDSKAAEQRDNNGRIPLHFACKEKKSGEVSTRLLLRAYPEGALVADEGGFLPLHVACRYSTSLSVIRMLIRAAPDSLLAKTKKGSTPMMCGQTNKCGLGEEIVGILERCAEESLGRSAEIQNRSAGKADCHSIKDSFEMWSVSDRSSSTR